jgi:hypothetical protein
MPTKAHCVVTTVLQASFRSSLGCCTHWAKLAEFAQDCAATTSTFGFGIHTLQCSELQFQTHFFVIVFWHPPSSFSVSLAFHAPVSVHAFPNAVFPLQVLVKVVSPQAASWSTMLNED